MQEPVTHRVRRARDFLEVEGTEMTGNGMCAEVWGILLENALPARFARIPEILAVKAAMSLRDLQGPSLRKR